MELPKGVHGVVLRSKPCPEAVREENEDITSFWAAETSFSNVTVREQEAMCPRALAVGRGLFSSVCSRSGVVQKRRDCLVPAHARRRRDA